MIDPCDEDVGRAVVYIGGMIRGRAAEHGVITSFNSHFVHVRYGDEKTSKATHREDLEWEIKR